MQFTKPPVSSPSERRQGPRRRLCTCLRYVFFCGGLGPGVLARVRALMCRGCLDRRTRVRVGYRTVRREPRHACAEIWLYPSARESSIPDAGETGKETPELGSPGAAAGRSLAPRGAGERASLASGRSPPRGCSRLLLRPAAERQLAGGFAVRLVRLGPVSKRVSGRKSRGGGEASRARERRAPLPGARRPLRLPGPARSLPPPSPSSLALPPPSIPGWMTEAFQTWAEREQASELWAAAISR